MHPDIKEVILSEEVLRARVHELGEQVSRDYDGESVLLVAVLPISVQGLGPTQGAMLVFFTRYAPGSTQAEREATILAASLSVQALSSLVQITIGALCIRSQIGRQLKQVSKDVPKDEAMSVKENSPESRS